MSGAPVARRKRLSLGVVTTRRVGAWAALVLGLGCHRAGPTHARGDAAAAVVREAAPSVPDGVLGRVWASRPRAAAEVVGQRAGVRVPLDLVLAVGAGVPMAVLGAVDTSLPLAACAVERSAGGEVAWLLAMTPRSAGEARTALASRHRLTPVAGLGERLEARGGARDAGASRGGVACALVAVADASSRVVCASDGASLERAGRWLAWTMTGDGTATDDDVAAEMAVGSAGRLRARWEAATAGVLAEWTEAASAERRAHAGPPDYGDPEAALVVLTRARDAVSEAIGELRSLRVGVRLGDEGAAVTAVAEWPRAGGSAVAADAVARAGAGLGGAVALGRWVAPDADVRGWIRTPGDGHRAWWAALVEAAVRVMGARLGDGAAARRTLLALGAESGEEAALGAVSGVGASATAGAAGAGEEWTVVVAQRDGGRSARSGLARLATEGWVRSLRWGGRAVRVSACGEGAWCVTMGAGAAPATAGAVAPATAGRAAGSMVFAVRGGALVAIAGAGARSALDGADARARAGGSEGGDGGVAGGDGGVAGESVVVTVRDRAAAGATAGVARGTYGVASGQGPTVTATGRWVVPWWVLERVRSTTRRGAR